MKIKKFITSVYSVYYNYKRIKLKREYNIPKEEIDFNGMHQDINYSRALYKELIVIAHPDRYVDEKKKKLAAILAPQVTAAKHNYKDLQNLNKMIKDQLM